MLNFKTDKPRPVITGRKRTKNKFDGLVNDCYVPCATINEVRALQSSISTYNHRTNKKWRTAVAKLDDGTFEVWFSDGLLETDQSTATE